MEGDSWVQLAIALLLNGKHGMALLPGDANVFVWYALNSRGKSRHVEPLKYVLGVDARVSCRRVRDCGDVTGYSCNPDLVQLLILWYHNRFGDLLGPMHSAFGDITCSLDANGVPLVHTMRASEAALQEMQSKAKLFLRKLTKRGSACKAGWFGNGIFFDELKYYFTSNNKKYVIN